MPTVNLSSPWIILYQEIKAMFEEDKEIKVVLDEENYKITLYVENEKKAEALSRILTQRRIYGNITVYVDVIPANVEITDGYRFGGTEEVYEAAFENNPALSYVVSPRGIYDMSFYVVFKNKVVQYFSDNLQDVNGLTSTLYQEIAKDIFVKEPNFAFFCTDVKENLGKPLGEWP